MPHPEASVGELLALRAWFPGADPSALSAMVGQKDWGRVCMHNRQLLLAALTAVAATTGARPQEGVLTVEEGIQRIRSGGIPFPEKIEKAIATVEGSKGSGEAEARASLQALTLVWKWAKANLPAPGLWARTSPGLKAAMVGLVVIGLAGGAVASMSPGEESAPAPPVVQKQPPRVVEVPDVPEAATPTRVTQVRPVAPKPGEMKLAEKKQLSERRTSGAEKAQKQFPSLGPEDVETVAKARRIRLEGQPQEAIDMMLGILERHPNDPGLLYELGVTYRLAGNKDETRALLVRSCKAGDERACKQVQAPPPARSR